MTRRPPNDHKPCSLCGTLHPLEVECEDGAVRRFALQQALGLVKCSPSTLVAAHRIRALMRTPR